MKGREAQIGDTSTILTSGPSHLFIATLLLIAARTPNKKGNANA